MVTYCQYLIDVLGFWGILLFFYRSSSPLTLLVRHSGPLVNLLWGVSQCPFLVVTGFKPMSLTLQCRRVAATLL